MLFDLISFGQRSNVANLSQLTMPPRNAKRGTRKRSRDQNSTASTSAGPNFDVSRFTSVENQDWYLVRANNTVLVEVDLDPVFDGKFHFREQFATMGWDCMLNLPRRYYPNLVRQFYANISNKGFVNSVELQSYVKGVHITLTRQTLSEILRGDDEGPVFEHGKYIVRGDPTWQFEVTLPKYTSSFSSFKTIVDPVTGDSRMESAPIPTKSLTLRHSLLVYLLNHNILPASSSKNEVRVMDVYFLDKLEAGLGNVSGIPISTIILGAMSRTAGFKGAKKALPYARTLTRIFEHFGVNLIGESYNTASAIVNQATMDRIAYRDETELGDEEQQEEGENRQATTDAGSSQATNGRTIQDMIGAVITEMRAMREVVDRLDGRVHAVEGRLSAIEDRLEALSGGQNTSRVERNEHGN